MWTSDSAIDLPKLLYYTIMTTDSNSIVEVIVCDAKLVTPNSSGLV
jgi:hypothetical protein